MVDFVPKERLDHMSESGKHQGVVANLSAFRYSTVEDMFALAEKRGEDPFFFLLDGIEDPHNLGAIIRTANLAGAHGVIIPNGSKSFCGSHSLYAGGKSYQSFR